MFNKLKKLSIPLLIIASVCTIPSMLSAQSFSGGRKTAVFEAYYDASVANYGYRQTYDQAIANWNATSSKVSITKTTSTASLPDKYYVGNTTVPLLWGQISPYKKNLLGNIVVAKTTDTWLYSTVSIYHNNMYDYSFTAAEIHSNATHEVGHTLSQAHPPLDAKSSVMFQGRQSIKPTSYDIASIQAKWGK